MDCRVKITDEKKNFIKSLNPKCPYHIILTEDCFLLLEKIDDKSGKIAFWSSLFAINDLQLNKCNKLTSINFYDDENNADYQLKLKIDNILLFRDIFVIFSQLLKANSLMLGKSSGITSSVISLLELSYKCFA